MSANIAEQVEGAANALTFVINLCASTSPMALTHPSTPELKKFTFFVTRQREDGRERFRLHMGYFPTQAEAEALLASVRDIYPAAWAGPAPSSAIPPRRVRADAAVAPAVAPVAAAKTPAAHPPVPPEPVLDAMSNVRDVLALLGDTTPKPIPAPVMPAPPVAVRKVTPVAATPRPATVAAPAPTPAPSAAKPPPAQPKAAPPVAKVAPPAAPLKPAQALEVLEMPAAPKAEAPKPEAPKPEVQKSAAAKPDVNFRPFGDEAEDGQVRVVTPEDTQTLTDIRLDRQSNAPPCFAVQLVWSVTPIDITKQAHLAIFDAYTLYNVEGNRQGRRWYGLRLGFFSDPNSATQVAYYVRSDYPKVAVVPVASSERDRANVGTTPTAKPRLGEQAPALKPETQTAIEKQGLDGFELLVDDRPVQPKRDVSDVVPGTEKSRAAIAAAIAKTGPQKPGAKTAGRPTGKRVSMRPRPSGFKKTYAPGTATPLESTLEILGASTLTLDESREIINDSAIRAPVKKQESSATGRFARLLGKLGGG
jgi:hypothetical protein